MMMQNDNQQQALEVRKYTRGVFIHQIVMAVVATIAGGFITKSVPWSLLWGLLASLGDNIIFLRGINRGLQYKVAPGTIHMRSRLVMRLCLLIVAVAVGLYLGLQAYGIFGGYILLHITLLINMIWLTKKQKK